MTTRQVRLLAIDDSLTIRRLLETVLTGAGYAVDFAATGQEGVDRARSAPPDLILLDYVLPDMKGVDVAAALARAENTRTVPVVVMSAKNADLRPLFRPFASVVGFMAKPFTPGEVCFLVAELVARAQGAEEEPPDAAQVAFTRPQLEAGARSLYGFLRDRFARIPEWAAGLADASPAPYFAKRILTPDLMERLLRGLAPVLRDALGAGAVASDGSTLQGHTSVLPLARLLRELSDSGRTGRLTLEYGARSTSLYIRRGELVLATHDQPDDYVRGHESALAGIEAGPVEAARAEQKKTGKPVFASLAEAGAFPPARAAELLRTLGKRALLEALEAGPVPFRWHDRALLAPYVEAHASAYSFEQLRLERLRQVDDWAQVELQVSSLAMVFHRVPGFSRKLGEFELDENERRVLTLVDSRRTVQQLVEKTGLPTFEVFHVLFRAAQVGLIRRAQAASGVEAEPGSGSRPVAILDGDVEGVEQPLARALQKRRHPLPLISLQAAPDLLASLVEKAPRLAILNVDTPGFDERRVVNQVRATLGVSDMALVAVLEEESDRAADLLAMGYDAVLVKPFPLSEVERFLAA
jgi:DNA-binding response OmpR family regulator